MNLCKKVWFFIAFISICIILYTCRSNNEKADASLIRNRIETELWGQAPEFVVKYEDICSNECGLFFDKIDYCSGSTSSWGPYYHLGYIKSFILSQGKDKVLNNGTVKSTIRGLVDYWIENNYISENWWYNQLGVPGYITDILILAHDVLTDDEIDSLLFDIESASGCLL